MSECVCVMGSSDDVAEDGMTESCDDDTGNDRVVETFIYPAASIYVYMTSTSGGPPFLCPDCDYKTTLECLFQGHVNGHNTLTCCHTSVL